MTAVRRLLRGISPCLWLTTACWCGVAASWAADGDDNYAQTVQHEMTLIPIRASGTRFRLQPLDRAFSSSTEVPRMEGRLFSMQPAVDHPDEEGQRP